MTNRMICLLIPFCLSFAHNGHADMRTWTDHKGQQVYAEWFRFNGTNDSDSISLRDQNGRERSLQLIQLSKADREYVRREIQNVLSSDSGNDDQVATESTPSILQPLEPQSDRNFSDFEKADNPSAQVIENNSDTIIQLIVLIMISPFAWLTSLWLERKRISVTNNTRPYKWGYFLAAMGLIFLPISIMGTIYGASTRESDPDSIFYWSVYGIVQGILSYFILKRNRIGWVAYLVLSFNPFFWLINGTYLYNRWHEMKQTEVNLS